ncbi:hypothetical protein ACFL3H_04310 [Gemmatimonadota bacterium]
MKSPSNNLDPLEVRAPASWLKDIAAVFLIYLLIVLFFRALVFSGAVFLKSPDGIAAGIFGQWGEAVLKGGTFPLWNPYIFSGMPSFGSLQFNPDTYPIDWLRPFFSFLFFGGNTPRILFHHLLGGLFTWLLLRDLGLSRPVAFFGAVVFFFTPQEIVLGPVSHGGKLFAITWLPLLLLLTRRFLNRPQLVAASLLAMVIALQLLALHMQIAYYGLMMIGLYFIIDAVQHRKERDLNAHLLRFGGLIGIGALALALSAYLLWPVYEYSQFSIRGGGAVGGGVSYEYATSWSFHPKEALTFLVPSWFGFGGTTYWGFMSFTDHPYYMGLVPLLLAVVAMVRGRKDRFVQVVALIGGLALLVSFGKWFPVLFGPLFKLLPFFGKFRVPAMILILLVLAVAVLAALGLHGLLTMGEDDRARWGRIMRTSAIVLGVLFLFTLAGKEALRSGYEAAAAARIGPVAARDAYVLFRGDLLRVLGITALAAFSLHVALMGRLKIMIAASVICLLTVVDMWVVNARLVETVPQAVEFESISANLHSEFLNDQPGPFRIANFSLTVPSNYWMSQRLEDVNGYSPAKLRHYQELLERQNNVMQTPNLLAMLNTRYILYHEDLPAENYRRVFSSGGVHIYEFDAVLGPAWLVGEVSHAESDEVILDALLRGFDYSEGALTTEEIGPVDRAAAAAGRVTLVKRDIHSISYRVEAGGPVLLVMSEIHVPTGWMATVDGARVPVHRVNHVLRAVRVEAPPTEGTARIVELTYQPVSVRGGRLLSVMALPLALLLAGIGLWRQRKDPIPVEETE